MKTTISTPRAIKIATKNVEKNDWSGISYTFQRNKFKVFVSVYPDKYQVSTNAKNITEFLSVLPIKLQNKISKELTHNFSY